MRCVAFRRTLAQLDFQPASGQQVQLRARLSLYQARGDLQLIVEAITRPSAGSLYEAFLRLKAQLQAEGLFDAHRKRPLPAFPRRLGLVTSAAGAAQHDVAQTLARRAPYLPIIFAPASVQGTTAPAELVAALQALCALPPSQRPDVILLVRGGGSAEDLAAFNDEALARCIAASPVPIISGVGHESDFSIADMVADMRAATPTAAAELAAPERSALLAELEGQAAWLARQVQQRLERAGQWLDHADMQLAHQRRHTVQAQQSALAQTQTRLGNALRQSLQNARHQLHSQRQKLGSASGQTLLQMQHALHMQSLQCTALLRQQLHQRSQVLSQCEQRLLALQAARAAQTVVLKNAAGHTISSVADVQAGEQLQAVLADGQLQLQVLSADKNATKK
jgi:exodeoxyribonuclease VII large subunit